MTLKTHTIVSKTVILSINHSIPSTAHCGDYGKDSNPWGDLQEGVSRSFHRIFERNQYAFS